MRSTLAFIRLLVSACLLVAGVSAHAGVTVQDVRVWAGPDGTRLVFDLSGRARYQLEMLANPDRVVIDVSDATLVSDTTLAAQGFFKQLRTSALDANTLRLVVDLTQAVQPHAFTVDPSGERGHRLVLDLKPMNASVTKSEAPRAVTASVPSPVRTVLDDRKARDVVVAIDAGHGGVDPGAIGKAGLREKDVTLAIARQLRDRINAQPGMRAILTRDTDVFIPLRDRIARAQAQRADIFVSVHADAVRDRSVAGSSVYVLSAAGASSEAARLLADRENAADLLGGVEFDNRDPVLRSVLLDLSQGASMTASIDAAHKVLLELDSVGNVRRPQVQHAGFAVLKSPQIPSMLVETAFISNPDEEKKLKNPAHQRKLADAISRGVLRYFEDNPPPGTRLALAKSKSLSPGSSAVVAGSP